MGEMHGVLRDGLRAPLRPVARLMERPIDEAVRVLVTVLGLDQHEAGAFAVARLLRDAGMEVVYPGRFQTAGDDRHGRDQEDVDVVGICAATRGSSCTTPTSWPSCFSAADPPIPIVVGGSMITAGDRAEVLAEGIDETVASTATEEDIVAAFRRLAQRRTAT